MEITGERMNSNVHIYFSVALKTTRSSVWSSFDFIAAVGQKSEKCVRSVFAK